ncbi:hypothetical protein DDW11_02855 [Sulfolobus sp. SCGC AB-777_G06]|nr:hypothetical protein DDW11_02855 [Sulfolobus sp. SCGC AB-777_G06]
MCTLYKTIIAISALILIKN